MLRQISESLLGIPWEAALILGAAVAPPDATAAAALAKGLPRRQKVALFINTYVVFFRNYFMQSFKHPGAGGGGLRDASPAEGASEAEAVQIVPDTTEEFPAVVEEASPPGASKPAEGPSDGREEPAAAPWDADVSDEPAEGPGVGGGDLRGASPAEADEDVVERPSGGLEGAVGAEGAAEAPDVTTLRAAETPDAAPVDLPAAKTDLPPSYPPPRRARWARARSGSSPRRRRRWIPHRSTILVVVIVIALTALFKTFVI